MYAFALSAANLRESIHTISKLGCECRVSFSHLIIKWLWVICEGHILKRSGFCARPHPPADDRVVRLIFVRGAFSTVCEK